MPALLEAFAAFNHGTEFATPTGPGMAVEDLLPGMELRLIEGGSTTILWIGSLDLTPQAAAQLFARDAAPLVRILPDRFGYARPARDLVMGALAQLAPRRQAQSAIDFETVLPLTPPGPVRLFQMICDRPGAMLIANGLGVPAFSLHPWLSQQDAFVQRVMMEYLPGVDDPSSWVA